jgi:hypothetical protein
MMIDKEHISFLLEDEYPSIGDYFGPLISHRLSLPEPEKCILIQYLDEKGNDLDLFNLDQTILYGEEYCERFREIFNIELNNKQNLDREFTKIFARLKAFEFLSKNQFRYIKWMGDQQKGISFISNRNNIHFALSLQLSSGIDEFISSFDNSTTKEPSFEYIKGELYSALSNLYKDLNAYCSSQISCQGILFISFGKDYLTTKSHGLPKYLLPKISAVLNTEWFALKDQGEKYKCLANIVMLLGIKGRDIMVYPKLRSSNIVY